MEIKVVLKNNTGFKWYSKNGIFVKGFAFHKNENFYEKEELVNLFDNINSLDNFEKILKNLNGSYAIIIQKKNKLFSAVDRLRSIPLFYSQDGDYLSITDTIEFNSQTIDENTPEYYEFLLSGYTINESTLSKEFKQIQSSEIIMFNDNQLSRKQYFKHTHQDYLSVDYKSYYDDLNCITDNFTKRLIHSVGEKTIVLPLSGGYDSRYILAALKRHNFTNVICYTYGNSKSFEVSIAKQVAYTLGYKIHIIEYTEEKWSKLLDNDKFIEYVNYSFNYSSLPHIQDFIALEELTTKKLIPSDSVIVPGFCGDLLGGSYIPIEIKENKVNQLLNINLAEYIQKKHFSNLLMRIPEKIKNNLLIKIRKNIICKDINNLEEFISLNESFFTEHKVSKFVVNALRPYEFFGFEWRMPLWDNELMEYWYKVPYKHRMDNKLYNDFLFDDLFQDYKIDIKKSKPISHNKFILSIRRLLPKFLYSIFQKAYHGFLNIIKDKDVNNFGEFGSSINKDLQTSTINANNINGLFAVWLLSRILDKK
ncbi:MAG: asparagine synthetase B family protein [Campylobacterota bacterium]|nr:asparagine synthetase B family protein [Campylobacterota bacterium]